MLGDTLVVGTGVVPNDEGAFLHLLGDETGQVIANDTHIVPLTCPALPSKILNKLTRKEHSRPSFVCSVIFHTPPDESFDFFESQAKARNQVLCLIQFLRLIIS